MDHVRKWDSWPYMETTACPWSCLAVHNTILYELYYIFILYLYTWSLFSTLLYLCRTGIPTYIWAILLRIISLLFSPFFDCRLSERTKYIIIYYYNIPDMSNSPPSLKPHWWIPVNSCQNETASTELCHLPLYGYMAIIYTFNLVLTYL